MKNLKLFGLSLMMVLAATACSEKQDPEGSKKDPIMKPFESVLAKDGEEEVEAVIDNAAKTINFEGLFFADLKKVPVQFNIAEGAKLIQPATAAATLDLSKAVKVIVNNGVKDITYTLTAEEGIYDPQHAGFQEDKSFGSLPAYLKVYKGTTFGPDKKQPAYLLEISQGATLGLAGTGDWHSAPTFNKYIEDNPGWLIYIPGQTSVKSMTIVNGEMKYTSGSPYSCVAIENGKYVVTPAKRIEITVDGAKVKVPSKIDPEGNQLVEHWKPTLAFGGDYMVANDGQILDGIDAMKKTGDCTLAWWENDNTDARMFAGVTEKGDKLYYLLCGREEGGLSMKEMRKLMLKVGCWDVLCYEGKNVFQFNINGKLARKDETSNESVSSTLMIK